jgi:hypothetical protein
LRGSTAKAIRRDLFRRGIVITSEPYTRLDNGSIVAQDGRQAYQYEKIKSIKKLDKTS